MSKLRSAGRASGSPGRKPDPPQKVHRLDLARPSPLPEAVSEGYYSGFLEDVCLSDFLQVLQLGMRSAEITIWSRMSLGVLILDQGRLLHAEAGDLQGDEAFLEICSWPSGEIHVRPLRGTPDSSVESSMSFLLLELARRIDTRAQRLEEEASRGQGAPSTPRELTAAPSPIEERISEHCETLVRGDSDAVAAAVFASGSLRIVGGSFSTEFSREHCVAFAKSIVGLYHLMDFQPTRRRHPPGVASGQGHGPLNEVEVSSADFHHFVRVLDPRPVMACLITRRSGNLGMGRALLNASFAELKDLVAGLSNGWWSSERGSSP